MLQRILPIFMIIVLLSACKKNDHDENKKIEPFDFLSSQTYESLTIDLVYIVGSEPNGTAIANLKAFLQERLNKPGGIKIIQHGIPSPAYTTYSIDDIKNLEEEHRKYYPKSNELAAFVFYADEDYSESGEGGKVLGVQYGPSSVAIFKSAIEEFSGGLTEVSEEKLETTILNHEFGHLMGLVNVGTEPVSDHEDGGHPGHCDNTDCLMYYAAEGSSFAELLLGEDIPALDEQCIQDLQANGGK